MKNTKQQLRRRTRIRAKLISDMPRLSIYRSNKHMYAQIISDLKKVTLVGIAETKDGADKKVTKTERARMLGKELAQRAKEKKIAKVVFDKGQYAYHGRVKAFAEGAREGGLEF